ncbi:hypothetical protein AK830_g8649 [Neonectria ditissima]|uniref:DUF3669 domain-containing protein n=1 Tax=Neonectria ditissima TaxID=78410 RepID=A0A0N8H645_9HYPO|nr:hypothetical protein AK830_g8649 [Neonectria ditissima]
MHGNNTPENQDQLSNHVLVKREGKYWITTRPTTTPTTSTTAAEHDVRSPLRRDRLGKLLSSLSLVKRADEEEFGLKQIATTKKSRVFTAAISNKTFAVKLCEKPYSATKELTMHTHVHNKIKALWPEVRQYIGHPRLPRPRVPRPAAAVSQRRLLGTTSAVDGLMMEYIEPLHHQQRRSLIKKYLDPRLYDTTLELPGFSEMRLDVHLGEMSSSSNRQMGRLQNRPAYFDQLWTECFDCIPSWAGMMGAALAVLHWDCGLDGRGVKFQLGLFQSRSQIWMADFGDCALIQRTPAFVESSLVEAIMENPAWPRPATAPSLSGIPDPDDVLPRTWETFRRIYLSTSMYLLFRGSAHVVDVNLPSQFICKMEAIWASRAENLLIEQEPSGVSSMSIGLQDTTGGE